MKNRFATSLVLLLAGVSLAGGLTGCAPSLQNSQWSGAESPKHNQVLSLHQTYDVHFDSGKDKLSPAEQKRLADFIANEDIGHYDEISIASGDGGDAKSATLAARRAASVMAYLRGFHLKSAPDSALAAPVDQVTISIARYVVVTPQCPDWRKPSEDDPGNTPSSNLGCANETNLGLMVADPRDLVVGKDLAPSDADHNDAAVQRYRLGKYKVPHDAFESAPDSFAPGTGIQDQKK